MPEVQGPELERGQAVNETRTREPNPRLAERDGCGCPPWVVRCVHFSGMLLAITDASKDDDSKRCDFCLGPASVGFGVYVLSAPPVSCPSCGLESAWYLEPYEVFARRYAQFEEAEAEFYRREADLLGREVPA